MKPTKPKLFPSEIEVLYWAARGKTAEETAIILDLSIHTIRTYRKEAIIKTQANNITQAVFIGVQWGLIGIPATH